MKRNLKVVLVFLIFCIFISLPTYTKNTFATTLNNEMKIYSINIGNENRGDSTLVESNGEFLLMDIGEEGSYPYIDRFLSEKKITHFSLYFSLSSSAPTLPSRWTAERSENSNMRISTQPPL